MENRINNAKLYRQIISEELIKNKEICIICKFENIESARQFIKEKFDRNIDYYFISDLEKESMNQDLIEKTYNIKIIFWGKISKK